MEEFGKGGNGHDAALLMSTARNDCGDPRTSASDRFIRAPDIKGLLCMEGNQDGYHLTVSDLVARQERWVVSIDEDRCFTLAQIVGELKAFVDDAHQVFGDCLGDPFCRAEVNFDGLPDCCI